ncbi:hypothetical protein quinque_013438 [Culex quinquefasciatus]
MKNFLASSCVDNPAALVKLSVLRRTPVAERGISWLISGVCASIAEDIRSTVKLLVNLWGRSRANRQLRKLFLLNISLISEEKQPAA